MKGRVRGLLGGTSPVNEAHEHTRYPENILSDPDAQRQALEVLTLAQRTADDHIATAQRQADKIRADARATAEQTTRDAEAHARDLQRQADNTLAGAQATATHILQEAEAHAEATRLRGEELVSDARTRAEEIVKAAQADADDLDHHARQQYQEAVGGLAVKREALQQQVEALERFDHEYRTRLTTFMQGQLRALWVDEPQVEGDIEPPAPIGPPSRSKGRTRSTG
jgi:vacuolar-type H+-ATPase subunit H